MSSSRMALVAAFGLAIGFTPAQAADLGGDCCADLEERVAELEATTARKGNRKVSLTVSGWVNEAVFMWDDGTERNTYVGTNSLEQSRVKFTGEAQIAPGYSAGYTLEIGIVGHASNKWDQTTPGTGSNDNQLTVRKSNWWLKSKDYGKVTVGLEGTAMYHILDDADGTNTRSFSDAEGAAVAQGAFFLRSGGAFVNNLRWSDVLRGVNNGTDGQDGRRNIVRYDSPTIAGFTVTASWGEDDIWAMALTYANTLGDFKLLGKVGYGQNSDETISACSKLNGQDCELFGAAGTIMHVPTGLYAYGGFAQNHDKTEAKVSGAKATDTMWFIQGGIEQKWLPLGKTTVFGEYRHDDGGSNLDKNFLGDYVHNSSLDFVGAGVVQNIEPAAMDLYVIYRHADGDITNASADTVKLDAFDMVIMGAMLKF
ncbi:porin [Hyphomicrobium facile]|uniref:porin n=1 Tax=Hyphomicrobium facile TaxID=51670 RepID=UPI001FCD5BB7|nr:porin [Hyphomicrobium facile]